MQEIGGALGIMRENTLILDTMDVSSVLMDSCLFDWIKGGKNLVEKYVEAHPPYSRNRRASPLAGLLPGEVPAAHV
jgi:hypothetical protein